MEGKAVFTTKEAAKYLGISTSTIYRMEKQGLITSIKTPGGQRRFSKEDIDGYLQRSKDFKASQNPSRFKRDIAVSETVTAYHANQAEYKGCIFTCTDRTEKECFDRMLFATNKIYEEKALKVKRGDVLFLLNLDSDVLYGPFEAKTDGEMNIIPEAWSGNYPYQVKVERNGQVNVIKDAKKILAKMNISWKDTLNKDETDLILSYMKEQDKFNWNKVKIKKPANNNEKPTLEATTLWDYPKQSYGKTPKGNNRYAGVTPAFIIYNMIRRYTEKGDLVVDPMAGSGTTLDVCKEEGRRCIAYDIAPPRPDIIQNDARNIPLEDNSVDMIFIDSPYGDNIKYNDHPDNIGNISSEDERFYDELEKVMKECHRILKPGKVLGWLIGDQWVKKRFTPVGFKVYERLCKYFETVDIVCVARRGQTSNTGIWYNRAIRFNFYLRGFKYLFLMRKPVKALENQIIRKINWTQYSRK
ncbi:MAG: DNA methyltransferase [Thermodesulfovibrionales bacterium]